MKLDHRKILAKLRPAKPADEAESEGVNYLQVPGHGGGKKKYGGFILTTATEGPNAKPSTLTHLEKDDGET